MLYKLPLIAFGNLSPLFVEGGFLLQYNTQKPPRRDTPGRSFLSMGAEEED